jgi:hypothetical protein
MTANKATAERQGLLLTRHTKEPSILTFDFAGEETRVLSGSQSQIRPSRTLVGIMVSRELPTRVCGAQVTLKSTGQTPIVMSATYHHCYF